MPIAYAMRDLFISLDANLHARRRNWQVEFHIVKRPAAATWLAGRAGGRKITMHAKGLI
jgi:hypothetical protein